MERSLMQDRGHENCPAILVTGGRHEAPVLQCWRSETYVHTMKVEERRDFLSRDLQRFYIQNN